jgi:hypothetical protein
MWPPSITTTKYVAGLYKLANDVMIVQRSPKQNPCKKHPSNTTQQTNKQKKPPKSLDYYNNTNNYYYYYNTQTLLTFSSQLCASQSVVVE